MIKSQFKIWKLGRAFKKNERNHCSSKFPIKILLLFTKFSQIFLASLNNFKYNCEIFPNCVAFIEITNSNRLIRKVIIISRFFFENGTKMKISSVIYRPLEVSAYWQQDCSIHITSCNKTSTSSSTDLTTLTGSRDSDFNLEIFKKYLIRLIFKNDYRRLC